MFAKILAMISSLLLEDFVKDVILLARHVSMKNQILAFLAIPALFFSMLNAFHSVLEDFIWIQVINIIFFINLKFIFFMIAC